MTRFAARRVLITGGSGGMGLAGARRIVDEGGRVVVTGRDADRLAAATALLGPSGEAIVNDAGDGDTGTALASHIADGEPLDGLWLNAAFATIEPPEAIDAATFDRVMAADVRGPVLQLAGLIGHLKDGASVIVTASSSAYEGAAATTLYAASKGAVIALVRSWATALAPRRIRVNTLVPGPIATGFRDFLPGDVREGFEANVVDAVLLGRIGSAEEAAAVALFLLSDDSAFVTGSQYAVDGGLLRR